MITTSDEFIGIREAQRRTGRSAEYILRMVVIGKVRTLIEPGEHPKYDAGDVSKLAQTSRRSAVA